MSTAKSEARPAADDNGHEHEVKLNGVTACLKLRTPDGLKITIYGWRFDRGKFKEGDRLLIIPGGSEPSTRYRITATRFPSDPNDQYFLDCEFHPRTAQA